MSLQMDTPPIVVPQKQIASHCVAPLTGDEISHASGLVRALYPSNTSLQFKVVTLQEPPKTEVLKYLEAEHSKGPLPAIERKAWVNYYIKNTNKFHEAIVNLSNNSVERNVRLGANIHGAGDGEEIIAIETIALEDERVKAEIAKLELPEGTVVVCDPWIYGSDGVNDDERMYQCFLYMRDPANPSNPDGCHYSFPLAISPVISSETMKVLRVDIMPTGADNTIKPTTKWQPVPANEYVSECQQLRTDVKPLHVVQPEGASFTVTEEGTSTVLEWQKWKMRVGFNHREGMVLHDVRYENRSLFYRLSLSDMNIPYADPRHPVHKKAAFDLGDVGAGLMANDLKLGCDCLGSIYYLSSVLSDAAGEPFAMPNVVCIHEQDAGIGWKHTNYRTGRAAVVRNREFVIQSIITVANYEYIMAFMFNQAGGMDYEVRATGILSTQPIDQGIEVGFGTVVHPGVLAVHHQHIFSLRVDPFIDGSNANRLVYEEAHAMPRSDFNPHGNGYSVKETQITHSGGYDLDFAKNRTFKIQNAAVKNPINGKSVGYKIHAPPFQYLLSDPDSYNYKRAEFADHNIYVVKHKDGELYSGGQYTNQSRGGTGVRSWAARNENVLDDDIVVYVQFGINHVPRIEDFPVMPCEIMKVAFKPVNFFTKNPAIDVPPSSQDFNKSKPLNAEAAEQHQQPGVAGVVGAEGDVCCTSKL
ncbi:TynA Cu2+-containing amine oxidase [Venturia nashicola]|uniref:Amine oxidase n=1 Tax=Venturia nashicola TaxID=86259 RepID=A0A4Z1P425_9PEZI|nr:TynA Cu2+-containing amine oxidase [Venturia nashicola]